MGCFGQQPKRIEDLAAVRGCPGQQSGEPFSAGIGDVSRYLLPGRCQRQPDRPTISVITCPGHPPAGDQAFDQPAHRTAVEMMLIDQVALRDAPIGDLGERMRI